MECFNQLHTSALQMKDTEDLGYKTWGLKKKPQLIWGCQVYLFLFLVVSSFKKKQSFKAAYSQIFSNSDRGIYHFQASCN